MSRAISVVALLISLVALATSVIALSRTSKMPAIAAVKLDQQHSEGPPPWEEYWRQLPADIRGAWPPAEFELKYKANRYVAICKNETIDFSDHDDEICRGSKVVTWGKLPVQ